MHLYFLLLGDSTNVNVTYRNMGAYLNADCTKYKLSASRISFHSHVILSNPEIMRPGGRVEGEQNNFRGIVSPGESAEQCGPAAEQQWLKYHHAGWRHVRDAAMKNLFASLWKESGDLVFAEGSVRKLLEYHTLDKAASCCGAWCC